MVPKYKNSRMYTLTFAALHVDAVWHLCVLHPDLPAICDRQVCGQVLLPLQLARRVLRHQLVQRRHQPHHLRRQSAEVSGGNHVSQERNEKNVPQGV